MVAAAGAGPKPLNYKTLSGSIMADAIDMCLAPATMQAAQALSQKMRLEDGVREAITSFHRNLPLERMHCDLIHGQVPVWYWARGTRTLKLSDRAAYILIERKKIEASSLLL